ncbi:short transient receptor potential channel 5 [Trichonephila clavata]|uniref:Short transient receptor potential channel 5 n=1 Tax=Trichonephila clavata TaxID=2740835 RepID=A0A8X6JJA3_TRICU|nr:short transient receptor potential channel 5 [Trichonephila clavata]
MVTVVVLLNMLIAMMTESYQRVQTNADMEWKFACSTLWLSVFDNHSVVPPPFNLIPSMHRITVMIRWVIASLRGSFDDVPGKISWSAKRCCYWDTDVDYSMRKAEEEKYEKLIIQLIRRYLHCNGMQSRCPALPNLTQDFKEQLKEEISQELRKSLRLLNRRKTRRRTIRNGTISDGRPTANAEINCQQIPPNCQC